MPSINRAINYLLHNRMQFLDSCIKNLGLFFPDKLYLTFRYRCIMGKWIDWNNPQTFTEKIQWLKLYDYKEEYTKIVDKYEVKQHVASKIGEQHIIPTIGVWSSVDDIDWDSLPNQFVLKTTHGGGGLGVAICRGKSIAYRDKIFEQLRESMGCVVGKEFRERPYYAVKRRIIAEPMLESKDGDLRDYKFFCFGGKVKFFKVDFGRFVEHHANYYDIEGNILPFGEQGLEPDYNLNEILPHNLQEMIKVAEKLSTGYKFIRIDLYNVEGEIYFGEMTLYPGGGMVPYTSSEWDRIIGDYLKLDSDES